MKNEPHIKDYFDDEEKKLIESMENEINKDGFVPVSTLTPERLEVFREAASNTINEKPHKLV